MKTRIDYLLLEILWLLAVTLGLAFWMTTRYAFNIFSDTHWKYLGGLQATGASVRTGFYVSLVVGVIIALGGMYILVRPRLRKIKIRFPKIKLTRHKKHDATPAPTPAPIAPVTSTTPASMPAPIVATKSMGRPPRPNTMFGAPSAAPIGPTPPATPATPITPVAPVAPIDNRDTHTSVMSMSAQHPEIRRIFESAGYTVKDVPSIRGFSPVLFAIGANEVLWIGGLDASTRDVRNAITALNKVFTDTLDDIEISVNGFAINAPDAATSEFQDILMFPDAHALGEYMAAHPNDTTDEDPENFDAYSEYIDTVIKYIGKK